MSVRGKALAARWALALAVLLHGAAGLAADGFRVVAIDVQGAARVSADAIRQTMGTKVGGEFAAHETVIHSRGEYVRGDVRTNSAEGYFGLFKKGMKGVYQHSKEKHLHRYLAEFDFRYSNRIALGVTDGERAVLAMKGIEGKRLTYRPTNKSVT